MLAMYIDADASESLWVQLGTVEYGDSVPIAENDSEHARLQQRAGAGYGLQDMDLPALCSDKRLVHLRAENRFMLHHDDAASDHAGHEPNAHAMEHRLRDLLEL